MLGGEDGVKWCIEVEMAMIKVMGGKRNKLLEEKNIISMGKMRRFG